jgi:hypothetical protein
VSTAKARENQKPAPKSADVIVVPSIYDDFMIKTGNIRVKFADGHSEVLTTEGNYASPRVSPDGKIGWLRVDKSNVDLRQKNRRGADAVIVRLPDGTTKEFFADAQAPFIGNWKFTAGGKSVAIESSSYHGPAFYVLYDIKSGKAKDNINRYVPYENLPAWAKPLAIEHS